MIIGRLISSLATAFVLLASSTAPAAQFEKGGKKDLAGSWNITVVIPVGSINCPGPNDCIVHALATATRDNAVVQTPALRDVSGGHGIWTYAGGRHYIINSTYFRFDPYTGEAIGTSATVTEVDLDKSGNTASGTFLNRLLDFDGVEIGSFSGTATVTRMTP
jgi:hypothetical protein